MRSKADDARRCRRPRRQHVAADAAQQDVERLPLGHAVELERDAARPATRSPLTMRRAAQARPFGEDRAQRRVLRVQRDQAVVELELDGLRRVAGAAHEQHGSERRTASACWSAQYTATCGHSGRDSRYSGRAGRHAVHGCESPNLPDVLDDRPDDVVQAELRLVADELPDLGDVRHPPRHVLEAGLVRLVVRDVTGSATGCRSSP